MEDAHVHILSMEPEDSEASYFAVFDGHGGSKVSAYCADNLHKFIVRRPEYKEGHVKDALRQGFLECDRVMRTEESLKGDMSGSTAVVVVTRGDTLWC